MLEYLILNNRLEAAHKFGEVSSKGYKQQLLGNFDSGKRQAFFRVYGLLKEQSKLQFYLRVYFLIYNIHPFIKAKDSIPSDQIDSFKHYLENKGSQLAKTTEFLQFYALPFIKKHIDHAAFKPIFKKQWVNNLRDKLKKFLNIEQERLNQQIKAKLFGQASALPSFRVANDRVQSNQSQKIKELQDINRQLFAEIKQFNEKYARVEQNHKAINQKFSFHLMESQSKWFQITKQLVNCSKSLIDMIITSRSDIVNHRKFIKIQKRTEKYDRFVNRKLDDLLSQSQDISIFDKPSVNQLSCTVTPTQRNVTTFLPIEQYIPTDFNYLKRDFIYMKNQDKKAVLEGLSWRLMRSRDCLVRKQNMTGIFISDLLNIKSGGITQLLTYRQLIKPTLQLLSCISQDKMGRRMLMQGNVHKDIMSLLTQLQDEQSIEYISVTLQLLSWNERYGLQMIEFGLLSLLIYMIKLVWVSSNQNILQNLVACILNLTHYDQGVQALEKKQDTMTNLAPLLSQDVPPLTRVIVMGLIYQLVSKSKKLFIMAQQANLLQIVNGLVQEDPTHAKQLYMLADQLKYFSGKKSQNSDSVGNYQNHFEDQSINFDEDEPENMEDLIKSHQFLVDKYLLSGKEAAKQMESIKAAIRQYQNEEKNPWVRKVEPRKQANIKIDKQYKMKKSQSKNQIHRQLKPATHQDQIHVVSNRKKSVKKQQFSSPQKEQLRFPQARKVQTNYQKYITQPDRQIRKSEDIRYNNFFENQKVHTQQQQNKKQNLFRVRDKQQTRNSERKNISRQKKSNSVQRRVQTSHQNHQKQYQSQVPMRQVTQFKAAQERGLRSPQHHRISRQQLLKQLNEEIKAEKKGSNQKVSHNKSKNKNLSMRQSQNRQIDVASHNKRHSTGKADQYSNVFQSKPKIRRTPPKD